MTDGGDLAQRLAETASRYPTPPQSTTTWSRRRTATTPETSAITRGRRPDRPQQRCAVDVADRHRQRVGSVVGLRRHRRAPSSARPSALPGSCQRGRAADRRLDLLRRVGAHRHAALPCGQQHHPACLPDCERGPHVGAEVQLLDRDRVGRCRRSVPRHARGCQPVDARGRPPAASRSRRRRAPAAASPRPRRRRSRCWRVPGSIPRTIIAPDSA